MEVAKMKRRVLDPGCSLQRALDNLGPPAPGSRVGNIKRDGDALSGSLEALHTMLQPAREVHIDPPPQAEVVLILAFLWPKVIEERPLHSRLRRFPAAACNGRCCRPLFRSRSLPQLSRLGKRHLRSAGGASPALSRRIARGTCSVFRTFAAWPQ